MPLRNPGRDRDPERGFSLVVVALLLLVLTTTAAIALHTTRTDLNTAGRMRESKYAFYAAEAGLASGKEFLSTHYDLTTRWSQVLTATTPTCIFPVTGKMTCCPIGSGTCIQSDPFFQPFASSSNPVLKAVRTGFFVTFRNNCVAPNCADPSGSNVIDGDGRVVVTSRGYGPNGSTATLELQVSQSGTADQVGSYGGQAGGGELKGGFQGQSGKQDTNQVNINSSTRTF